MYTVPDLRNRILTRPRLRYDAETKTWTCSTYWGCFRANGITKEEAWAAWKVKDQRTHRVPRLGIQNKRRTLSWFRQGCFLINSWIGDKVIFGYDPTTDELILKG